MERGEMVKEGQDGRREREEGMRDRKGEGSDGPYLPHHLKYNCSLHKIN